MSAPNSYWSFGKIFSLILQSDSIKCSVLWLTLGTVRAVRVKIKRYGCFIHIIGKPVQEIYYFYPTSARLWWKRLPVQKLWTIRLRIFKIKDISARIGFLLHPRFLLVFEELSETSAAEKRAHGAAGGTALLSFWLLQVKEMPTSTGKGCAKPNNPRCTGTLTPASLTFWKQPHEHGCLRLSGTLG